MYVNEGTPLYWLLGSSPHLLALLMIGVIIFAISVFARGRRQHGFNLAALAYTVLGVVVALVVVLGGYAITLGAR